MNWEIGDKFIIVDGTMNHLPEETGKTRVVKRVSELENLVYYSINSANDNIWAKFESIRKLTKLDKALK